MSISSRHFFVLELLKIYEPLSQRCSTHNSSEFKRLIYVVLYSFHSVWTQHISNLNERLENVNRTQPASRGFFWLLEWGDEKVTVRITSNLWSRRSLNFWTSQSCFPRQTGFIECEHPFIDKPMVINEPAVASAWFLGLGPKLYLSNMPHMLNKDLTRLTLSLSRRLRQNRASERKTLLAWWWRLFLN